MPRLRTTVSQFALVSGRRRNHTETIACRVPSRRRPGAREAAHLYVMVEHAAADGQDHDLAQIVMREMQLAFVEEESAGAALALSRAITGINQVMWEETRRMAAHRRLPLGLVALVLDGDDAYVCQLATGQFYISRADQCRSVPVLGYWQALHEGAAPAMPTLGQTPDLKPEILHVRLMPGDWLALCATNLARLVEPTTLQALIGQPVETITTRLCAVAEDYGLLHTSGLVIQIKETPHAAIGLTPLALRPVVPEMVEVVAADVAGSGSRLGQLLRRRPRPVVTDAPAPVAPSLAEEITAPVPVLGEVDALPDNIVRLYTTPPLAPVAEPIPAVAAPSGPMRPRLTPAARPLRARWLDALAASVVLATDAMRGGAEPATAVAGVPGATERRLPRPTASRRGADTMAAEPLYRAGNDTGGAATAAAVLEGAGAAILPRVLTLNWPRPSSPIAILLVVVTAALVLASIASTLLQTWHDNGFNQSAPAVVQQAREQREAAVLASSAEQARQTLEQVQETLAQAQAAPHTSAENAAQIAAERTATQLALDALNRVTRLEAPVVLTDLSASGTPETTPKQLVVSPSGQLYVLDPYTNTLYLVDQQGKAPTALLAKGWNVSRQKVSDLVGIAWRGDTLVAMDRSRVYTLDGPNGTWRTAPLAGATIGLGAHPVSTFSGGLYVLDNASQQILKFAQGAYEQAPTAWLKKSGAADLSSAIDIAIDGRIYALTATGQIHSLSRGSLEKTHTIAVSPAMRTPTALVAPAGANFLYVAEAEGRVIKLTKEGALVQQYQLAESDAGLSGLSALVVDEESGIFYAVAGNRVLRLALPQSPSSHAVSMQMQ